MLNRQGHGLRLFAVAAITIALLLPFVNKAFHVDDTLFLYSARQILKNPLRPYDFMVHWNPTEEHMWEVTMNPPLASYYSAAITGLFGEREVALHLAYMLPALGAGLATYWLALSIGASPFWSAIILVASPGFLVTATGVSSDMITLSFYVIAVAAFVRGSQKGSWGLLVFSSLAAGLCSVSKYIGITVVPLLVAYSVIRERRISPRLLVFLITLAIFSAWAVHGMLYYGRPHFFEAAMYKSKIFEAGRRFSLLSVSRRLYLIIASASFFAGSLGPSACLSAWFCRHKLRVFLISALAACVAASIMVPIRAYFGNTVSCAALPMLLAFVCVTSVFLCWCFGGMKSWSPERWLLALWVFGILLFAAYFNWTVAVRVVLFCLPAAAILLGLAVKSGNMRHCWVKVLVGATVVLALVVTAADYHWSGSYRRIAHELMSARRNGLADTGERYKSNFAGKLYFQAHWGLQFYLERAGWEYFVWSPRHNEYDRLESIDRLVLTPLSMPNKPLFDAVDEQIRKGALKVVNVEDISPFLCVHTQNKRTRAGFYSAGSGPVPYLFSRQPCETFILLEQP